MGTKRLLTVVLVTVFVLGLVVVLLFQSGADEYVVGAMLPKLEQRLGLKIDFKEVDTSLTSVALSGVEVRSVTSDALFFKAGRIWLGIKMGPLFFGDIDITGIRFDELEIRVGQNAKGAAFAEWRDMIGHLEKAGSVANRGKESPAKSDKIEIEVASGSLHVRDQHFYLKLENITGKTGSDKRLAFDAGNYDLSHDNNTLLNGKAAKFRFVPETMRATITLKKSSFALPVAGKPLVALFKDAKNIIERSHANDSADAGASPSTSTAPRLPLLHLVKHIALDTRESNARFWGTEQENSFFASDIALNSALSSNGNFSAQLDGRIQDDNNRFAIGIKRTADRPLTATIEFPGLSLSSVGKAILPSEHINWEKAAADGTMEIQIAPTDSTITLSGQIGFSGLTLDHERLALEPIENLGFNAGFKLALDPEKKEVLIDNLIISRDLTRFMLKGKVLLDRFGVDLYFEMPPVSCDYLKTSLPEAFTHEIIDIKFDGHIGLGLHLAMDENDPEQIVLDPELDNRCRIVDFGKTPKPSYFRGPFSYVAYTAEGEDLRLVTGPGTERWTPLIAISPYLVDAVLTTEDGKFFRHKGITVPELRGAISRNLQKRSLRHGASTITMQLAKNLFLNRERTIARKLQELVYVWYLETNFSKEEILELYLNVIEFGPSLYGIREAAAHYFGRDPMELNAMESVFLIKLLPNPVARHASYERGKISERQSKVLKRVLKIMRDKKRLTEAEYNQALSQKIEFHRKGTPLPPPRPPVVRHVKLEDIDVSTTDIDAQDSDW